MNTNGNINKIKMFTFEKAVAPVSTSGNHFPSIPLDLCDEPRI